jgi:hypothetical protein
MSYTKLEWQYVGTTVFALEFDSWSRGKEVMRNRFTAYVQGYRDTPAEELKANARLMAAAPELLEALQAISDLYDTDEGCRSTPEYIKARTAIKKALGE